MDKDQYYEPTSEEKRANLVRMGEVISRLSSDDQILVACMAQTIRNVASMNGKLGEMALILVGAEWAARQ